MSAIERLARVAVLAVELADLSDMEISALRDALVLSNAWDRVAEGLRLEEFDDGEDYEPGEGADAEN